MRSFVHDSPMPRVIFGVGALAQLRTEVERIGAARALVLATPEQRGDAQRVARSLGPACVGLHARARMHVPRACVDDAIEEATRLDADCTVAFGGGSTTGLAKALALERRLPIVAVPTTYAGSEMTSIYGITQDGLKRTGRSPAVLPSAVLYDPELTVGLPVALSVTSAFNALAHAVEGLYAAEPSPLTSRMAVQGIRSLARALPWIAAAPHDLAARAQAQYGAWLCGAVLGAVGMALHHKLCHVLGGSFELPHAETHAVLLPHVLAFNTPAAPRAARRIARALDVPEAACGLYDLAERLGAPLALAKLGLREDALDRAAEVATRDPYYNPRPVDRHEVRKLLEAAYHGRRPAEIGA